MIWQSLNRDITYRLYLCDSVRNITAEIPYTDLTFKPRFNDVNELNFQVQYVLDQTGTKDNRFDMIQSTSKVLMEINNTLNNTLLYSEYFTVETPESSQDSDGKITKQVECVSEHYMFLSKQYIPLYKDVKKLYDGVGSDGIINYMLSQIYNIYTVSYISPSLVDIYRSFDYTSKYQWEIYKDLSEQFNCAFLFDNINNTIQIRAMNDIGIDIGIILNNRNFIKSISLTDKVQNLTTRLHVYGKSKDVNIRGENITGQNYIDNFDDIIARGLMSSALASKYNLYKAFVASKDGVWTGHKTQLDGYITSLTTKNNELVVLKQEKIVLETQIATLKKQLTRNNAAANALYTQLQAKNAEIANKEAEIVTVNNNIVTVNDNISALNNEISWGTYFTLAERQELIKLTYSEEFNFDSIDETQTQQLYEYAIQYLELKSRVPVSLKINSVDMLGSEEFSFFYDKVIRIGDYLTVDCPELGYNNVSIRVIEISHNPISKDLEFTCSNQDSLQTDLFSLRNIFITSSQGATLLNSEKESYGQYTQDKDTIIYSGDTIDTSENEIVAGDNVINSRGFKGTNLGSNGTLEYLADKITLSRDGGATWRTFASSDGLYMENASATGRTVISPETGFQIDKWDNGTNSWDNVFYLDIDGNAIYDGGYIRMLTTNNKNQLFLDPSVGFKMQKLDGLGGWTDNFYLDTNGNVIGNDATFNNATIQGVFKTGITGARIEIDDNGIKSYNSDNNLHGIYIDKSSVNGLADLKLYYNGSELFTVQNDVSEVTLKALTNTFLYYSGASNVTVGQGNWEFAGNIGFFGATPVTKTSILDPLATTVSGTASDIYGSSEADMINDLRDDVRNLRTKVLELTNLLQSYGLG